MYVQGQQDYKPVPTGAPTTTVPPPTSSTSTTTIGAGGSVNFPVTPVPDQAAAFITASGLNRDGDTPYYHSAFGAPFELHMVYDSSDPWASEAAPVIRDELEAAGLETTLDPVDGVAQAGQVLADGFADLAADPGHLLAVHEPDHGVVHDAAGPAGKERISEDWTNYSNSQFDQTVETASAAAEPHHRGRLLPAGGHAALGRDGVAAAVSRSLRPWSGAGRSVAWSRCLVARAFCGTPSSGPSGKPESTSNTTPSLPGQ